MGRERQTYLGKHWPKIRERAGEFLARGIVTDRVEAVARAAFEVSPESGLPEPMDAVPPREMTRLYLHVLSDNDRAPEDAQLAPEDLGLLRRTLRDFFGDQARVAENVGQIFRLVQRKMEAGRISQAWNILQVFEYDREVRLNNERNLFLEEMALRFGKQPASLLDGDLAGMLREMAIAAAEDLGKVGDLLAWLDDEVDVRLLVLQQDQAVFDTWRVMGEARQRAGATTGGTPEGGQESAAAATSEGAAPPLPGGDVPPPDVLVPFRWRPWTGDDPAELVGHLRPRTAALRHHARHLLNAAYFLALLNEYTGYERFLPALFRWFRTSLKGDSINFLADVHRRVALEERTVREAVEEVAEGTLEGKLGSVLQGAGDAEVEEALRAFLRGLAGAGADCLIPGNYALNSFLVDELTGLDYERPSLRWRLHRLL